MQGAIDLANGIKTDFGIAGDWVYNHLYGPMADLATLTPQPDGSLRPTTTHRAPEHSAVENILAAIDVVSLVGGVTELGINATERATALAIGSRTARTALANGATREEAIALARQAINRFENLPPQLKDRITQSTTTPDAPGFPKTVEPVPEVRDLPGVKPQPMSNGRRIQIADGEGILAETMIGGPDSETPTFAQLVLGDLPADDPARQRAAQVVGGTAKFNNNAVNAGMQQRALQWAMNQAGPGNPRKFANAYEYYKGKYQEAYDSVDPKDILKGENKDSVAAKRLDDYQVTKNLEEDIETVRRSGKGAVDLRPWMSQRDVVAMLRQNQSLGFGDEFGSAYHALRHWKNMPDSEKELLPSRIEAYQNSADLTVREGRLVGIYPRDGVMKYVFQRDVIVKGKPNIVETIVNVTPDGRAMIATYGQPTAVKPGPDGTAPPEIVPDPGMSQRYPPSPWSSGKAWSNGLVPPSLALPPILGMRPGLDRPAVTEPRRDSFSTTALAPQSWIDNLIGSIRHTVASTPAPSPILEVQPISTVQDGKLNQSLTVNINSHRRKSEASDAEMARVIAYGAHIK
ncbi:hypothetical protein ACQPXH_00160 [Nocardia sp. CA-135953]|uniref:hypothetical protein n=1 Tax=Nocardia sp. CA-135953 TaxID=3239978 RepID=UPI003D98EDE0